MEEEYEEMKTFENLRETFDCEQCKAFCDEIGVITKEYEAKIKEASEENNILKLQLEAKKAIYFSEEVERLEVRNKELEGRIKDSEYKNNALLEATGKQFDENKELKAQQEWQPIETAPRDGKIRIYGLWVYNRISETWHWEEYVLYLNDEGELKTPYEDEYFSVWSYDAFTHWYYIPQPPKQKEG